MFKLLTPLIAGGTILASAITPVSALSQSTETQVPYVTTSRALPRNARVSSAKYQLGLMVGGYPISEVSVGIPDLVRIGSVSVQGQDRQLIETTTSVEDGTALIKFAQPVAPGTPLRIELSSVQTQPRSGRIWMLPISVQEAGSARNIPIGMARVHTYSN